MWHADDAERQLLQVRELWRHIRVQLRIMNAVGESPEPETAVQRNGILHIVCHFDPELQKAAGYSVTYHRVESDGGAMKVRQFTTAMDLIHYLERLGVDLSHARVLSGLAELYARGSASIPDVWLTDEQVRLSGLA